MNIDTIVKDENRKLQPYDLNAPSFIGWFLDEAGYFEAKTIILFGVGGVGETLARGLVKTNPRKVILVDIVSKNELVKELATVTEVDFYNSLSDIKNIESSLVFINAAGKEGADDSTAIGFLEEYQKDGNVFVDLRLHLDIDLVEKAKGLTWDAYTWYGMNARNDYTLLEKITNKMGEPPITFHEFKELIAKAS